MTFIFYFSELKKKIHDNFNLFLNYVYSVFFERHYIRVKYLFVNIYNLDTKKLTKKRSSIFNQLFYQNLICLETIQTKLKVFNTYMYFTFIILQKLSHVSVAEPRLGT